MLIIFIYIYIYTYYILTILTIYCFNFNNRNFGIKDKCYNYIFYVLKIILQFYFFFAIQKNIRIVGKFYYKNYKIIKCIENSNVLRITKYFLKYSQQ